VGRRRGHSLDRMRVVRRGRTYKGGSKWGEKGLGRSNTRTFAVREIKNQKIRIRYHRTRQERGWQIKSLSKTTALGEGGKGLAGGETEKGSLLRGGTWKGWTKRFVVGIINAGVSCNLN